MGAVMGAPGADLAARNQHGYGILHIAACNWGPSGGGAAAALEQRAPGLVAAALAAVVDINARAGEEQRTALHEAAVTRSLLGPMLLPHADPK